MSNPESHQESVNPQCLNCPTVKLYHSNIDQDRKYQAKITNVAMDEFDKTTSIRFFRSFQETTIRLFDIISKDIASNEQRIAVKTNHCQGPIKIKPSLLKRLFGNQEEVKCSLDIQDQAEMAPVGPRVNYNRQIDLIRKKALKEVKKNQPSD